MIIYRRLRSQYFDYAKIFVISKQKFSDSVTADLTADLTADYPIS